MVKPTICNSDAKTPVIPEFCDDGLWEVPVNSLSEIKKADRDHAYILPDNSVWVLSHDGKNFIQINLASSGEGQPTQVTNKDGFIAVEGSGTHSVSVNLDIEKMKETFQEKLTAGANITIENNVISTTGGNEDSQYWAFFNPAYTQLRIGAIGDKTDRVLYLAGEYYEDTGSYNEVSDTTYWHVDFDLAKADIISNLVIYRGKGSKQIDYEYSLENDINTMILKNKRFMVYGGLTIMANNDKLFALNTNSLNLGTLSSDFSYFLIQSLNFFTIKLRVESAFYLEPKEGAIVRKQNYKNRPQITREILKEKFAFDVAVLDLGEEDTVYKNYTIVGYYQMLKNPLDNSYDFELSLLGMFSYQSNIPYDEELIISDENNVFSPNYIGNEYQLSIRPKTVFL